MSATAATRTLDDASESDSRALLIRYVRLDAIVSAASGVALAAGAPVLDGVLGMPVSLLVPLGVFLLVYAAALVGLAREGAPAPAVTAVIVGNAAWAIVSVVAVLADWLTPTTVGTVVVLGQAAVVALLAELQLMALRRS